MSLFLSDVSFLVASAGSGGDALTTNPLSQFAATTSDELAGVISNETGTGALVFGDDPFISGLALKRKLGTSINSSGASILVPDNSGGIQTVTIQTADIVIDGRVFIIKDESGVAGTNNITVETQAAETIDGVSSVEITANYGVMKLYSNGANLFSF